MQDMLDRAMNRKRRFSEMKDEDDMHTKLQQRKLSANERELNRFMDEERQERIKQALAAYRKKKQDEFWHEDRISQPFIFKSSDRPLATQGTVINKCNLGGGVFLR